MFKRLIESLMAVLALIVGGHLTPSAAIATDPAITAAFFYPWYPETERWQTHYSPALGKYDSGVPSVLATQMSQVKWAGIDAVISSWWSRGSKTDGRLPLVLDAAAAHGVRVTAYYEPESVGNPTVAALQADLVRLSALAASAAWLRVDGKPVLFVYNADDTTCEVASRWREAAGTNWYLQLKVFVGYQSCAVQPDSWHQYGPAAAESSHRPHAMNLSPGFFKFNESTPRLPRDPNRWRSDLSAMADAAVRWKLLTTFNEWGEGSSMEPAAEWQTCNGMGEYLSAVRQVFVDGVRFNANGHVISGATSIC